jgi:hypothetical protein
MSGSRTCSCAQRRVQPARNSRWLSKSVENHNPRVGGSSPSSGMMKGLQKGVFRNIADRAYWRNGPEMAPRLSIATSCRVVWDRLESSRWVNAGRRGTSRICARSADVRLNDAGVFEVGRAEPVRQPRRPHASSTKPCVLSSVGDGLVARASLSIHPADLRLAPTPELRLHKLAKIDRDRNAANDRRLAERAPCAVFHCDPSGGIRTGHGSNGATRCTVVQLCRGGF